MILLTLLIFIIYLKEGKMPFNFEIYNSCDIDL